MRKIFALLLLIGVVAITYTGVQWLNDSGPNLEPLQEALPTTSVKETTSTTQPTPHSTVPPAHGDVGEDEVEYQDLVETEVVDYADPEKLRIPAVDINATVDNVTFGQPNTCGRLNNPCFGRNMLDAWTDQKRVGVCETGASFITGHTTSGNDRPDTFTNLIDDPEFSYDIGVEAGDEVIVDLVDGSRCVGQVVEFTNGPGDKIPDSPGRFFEKLMLGEWVADALSDVAGEDSVGFLMTSYCGECLSKDWYPPGTFNDNEWHRRYTAVIKVDWVNYIPVEELVTRVSS